MVKMAVKKSEKLKEDIMREYNRKPTGWHILTGRGGDNYHNLVILHGKDMWVLKEELLNPYRTIGYGEKVKVTKEFRPFLRNPYSYGFRPLTPNQGKKVINNDLTEKTIKRILSKEPVPYNDIDSFVLEGPILTSQNLMLPDTQKKLDARLRKSLRKLIYRDYPELMKGYV